MITCPRRHFLVPAFAILIAGCVAEGAFPSLAPRAAERELNEEPETAVPAIPSDPALTARAAELVLLARAGEREFSRAYPEARPAARAAGVEGSESWVVAQEWISGLEAARVETMRALAELDQLLLARAGQPTSESDFAALQAALEEAERIAANQQTRIDSLREMVRR